MTRMPNSLALVSLLPLSSPATTSVVFFDTEPVTFAGLKMTVDVVEAAGNQMEGEIVVLTGKLEIMGRSEAGKILEAALEQLDEYQDHIIRGPNHEI